MALERRAPQIVANHSASTPLRWAPFSKVLFVRKNDPPSFVAACRGVLGILMTGFRKIKKTQRVLREIDIQHGGGAAGCLSVGHNKPQSSPFIQIVKLAWSPPEITRISVPTFADLNKSRQGHLIGVE